MRTINDFLEAYRVSSKPLKWSLDKKGRDELELFISEEKQQAKREYMQRLKDLGVLNWTGLDPREQKILTERFVNLKTLEEVGEDFGVTRDRIRQLEARAIERLTN
jgi:RNA polymerase primary sigma factor